MRWPAALVLCVLAAAAAAAERPEIAWTVQTRVAVDAAAYGGSGADRLGNGAELRRARVILSAGGARYDGKIDVDLAGDEVTLKDAYLRRRFRGGWSIRVGHVRGSFGLEPNTSSRDLVFVERAAGLDAFGPGRRVGIEGAVARDRWRVSAALQGAAVGDEPAVPEDGVQPDQPAVVSCRATWRPWRTSRGWLHLGASGVRRGTTGHVDRFRSRDELHLTGIRFLDTGALAADEVVQAGAEVLAVRGGWRVQAEGVVVRARRDAGGDPGFTGAYVQLSRLWGARYRYHVRKAVVDRVRPEAGGAWELGLRWSSVDLDDRDVRGGRGTILSAGVNWYPEAAVRISLAWLHVDHGNVADAVGAMPGDLDYDAVLVRCRLALSETGS